MKIALFQMYIEWENKKQNYKHLESELEELQGKNLDLLLLPEMSFTGFSMDIDKTKEADNQTVNQMKEYATRYNVSIGFGWVKDYGEKAENHYTIVDKDGKIVSDYIKIHPFSYSGEDKKFQSGKQIVSCSFQEIEFSTFICYDLRFPDVFQIASKTADIIIVPANWPQSRSEHWKTLLKARAIENQVYILAINCYGIINNQYYSGDSCVINPNGQVLERLSDTEGIVFYELLNDVKKYRNDFPTKKDRAEDLYRIINDRNSANAVI